MYFRSLRFWQKAGLRCAWALLLSLFLPGLVSAGGLTVTVSTLINYNGQDISCVGACDGVVIANVSGGTPPYTFLWEDGQSTQVAIGLCAGSISVNVSDASGTSTGTGSITLNPPPPLVVTATPFTFAGGFNISCFGENDGQITASSSGGVGGYTYFWSDGQLGPAALNAEAGIYFVQVTDLNGCTDLDSVIMTQPDRLQGGLSNVQPVSCNGRSDGNITVIMSGGSAPFTYSWSDGPGGAFRSGLSPGTYSVDVTDLVGCTWDTTFTINTAPAIQVSLDALSPQGCEGVPDGAAQVDVGGGSPPYTYRWSNGLSTQNAENLLAGSYLLTVRDSRGCSQTLPVTVERSSTLTVNALQVNPSCNASDGAIHLTISGHIGSLSYLWSDGQTGASAIGLQAGIYDVVVMDDSCTVTRRYYLDNRGTLQAAESATPTACNAPTGTATALAGGGFPPYTWLWNDGQTTQTASSLDVGIPEYQLTDSRGCSVFGSIPVVQDNDLGLSAVVTPPSTCNANNASALVLATGGIAPYTYAWSQGANTAAANALRTGVYAVRVTDVNSCTDTLRVAIESGGMALSIVPTDAFCSSNSASASASVSGGTAPLRYRWSSGDTTAAISGKSPALYDLLVRDALGCLAQASTALSRSPGVHAVAEVSGVSCESLEDGAIQVDFLAGLSPFSVFWTDGAAGPIRTGLIPGVYEVQVRDAANCQASGPIEVGDGCDLPLDAVDDFLQLVEGVEQFVDVLANDSYPDRPDIFTVLVELPVHGIVIPAGDGGFAYTAPEGFVGLDSFSYALCNGFGLCDTAWVILSIVPRFQIPDAFSPNGDGINDVFAIRGIEEYSGNTLVVFNRWGTEIFRTRGYTGDWDGRNQGGDDLPAGTYYYSLELGEGLDNFSGFVVIHR